jgi:hypothetical protein
MLLLPSCVLARCRVSACCCIEGVLLLLLLPLPLLLLGLEWLELRLPCRTQLTREEGRGAGGAKWSKSVLHHVQHAPPRAEGTPHHCQETDA